MSETWKRVVGFEGLYEVSDLGRVRSLDRTVLRSDGRHARLRGRLLCLTPDKDGYPFVVLSEHGITRPAKVHRLVLAAFGGPLPDGQEVRHLDGNRQNARLGNLIYGTRQQNLEDARRHGTWAHGESHGHVKLTEAAVRTIRRSSRSSRQEADVHGVASSLVRQIRRGEIWRHV